MIACRCYEVFQATYPYLFSILLFIFLFHLSFNASYTSLESIGAKVLMKCWIIFSIPHRKFVRLCCCIVPNEDVAQTRCWNPVSLIASSSIFCGESSSNEEDSSTSKSKSWTWGKCVIVVGVWTTSKPYNQSKRIQWKRIYLKSLTYQITRCFSFSGHHSSIFSRKNDDNRCKYTSRKMTMKIVVVLLPKLPWLNILKHVLIQHYMTIVDF